MFRLDDSGDSAIKLCLLLCAMLDLQPEPEETDSYHFVLLSLLFF